MLTALNNVFTNLNLCNLIMKTLRLFFAIDWYFCNILKWNLLFVLLWFACKWIPVEGRMSAFSKNMTYLVVLIFDGWHELICSLVQGRDLQIMLLISTLWNYLKALENAWLFVFCEESSVWLILIHILWKDVYSLFLKLRKCIWMLCVSCLKADWDNADSQTGKLKFLLIEIYHMLVTGN